jgi:hypothetical protein
MRIFNTTERKFVVSDSELLVMLVTLVHEGSEINISERIKVI